MNITELKQTIAKITATAEAKFGTTNDGAFILDNAHHACIPANNDGSYGN